MNPENERNPRMNTMIPNMAPPLTSLSWGRFEFLKNATFEMALDWFKAS